jgi:hypothetical protein
VRLFWQYRHRVSVGVLATRLTKIAQLERRWQGFPEVSYATRHNWEKEKFEVAHLVSRVRINVAP